MKILPLTINIHLYFINQKSKKQYKKVQPTMQIVLLSWLNKMIRQIKNRPSKGLFFIVWI